MSNALRRPLFGIVLIANLATNIFVPDGPARIALSVITGVVLLALIVEYVVRGRRR